MIDQTIAGQPFKLLIWVVTYGTKDLGDVYCARVHQVGPGYSRATEMSISGELETIREAMRGEGRSPVPRSDGDDPVIVETWI